MKRLLSALSLLLCATVAVPAVAEQGKPKVKSKRPLAVPLPPGFGPEGLATAPGGLFYVGGRETGAIYRGSLRTGAGAILVEGAAPVPNDERAATGLKVDGRNRLYVSGADSKHIRVYDATTGDELRAYPVPDAGFINDVIVTRGGVYFTDSGVPQLYRLPFDGPEYALGELEAIPLTGALQYDADPMTFELNGIAAILGGARLIVIQSRTGKLFDVDAATGVTREIPIRGGDGELDEGDGLLRQGRRLFVVENQDNRVTVVKVRSDLASGRIVREIDSPLFDVPTTIARSGGRNYVVNAKFGRNTPEQTYEVVKVPTK